MHGDHPLLFGVRLGTLTAMGGGLSALLHNPVLGAFLTLLGGVVWEVAKPTLRHVGEHVLHRLKRRVSTLPPPVPPAPTADPPPEG